MNRADSNKWAISRSKACSFVAEEFWRENVKARVIFVSDMVRTRLKLTLPSNEWAESWSKGKYLTPPHAAQLFSFRFDNLAYSYAWVWPVVPSGGRRNVIPHLAKRASIPKYIKSPQIQRLESFREYVKSIMAIKLSLSIRTMAAVSELAWGPLKSGIRIIRCLSSRFAFFFFAFLLAAASNWPVTCSTIKFALDISYQ